MYLLSEEIVLYLCSYTFWMRTHLFAFHMHIVNWWARGCGGRPLQFFRRARHCKTNKNYVTITLQTMKGHITAIGWPTKPPLLSMGL